MSVATCSVCTAPSPAAFLCRTCVAELRQMLTDLPWWIDRLAEAAVGQAKLGDGGRSHTTEGIVRYADERIDEDTGARVGDENLERDIAAGRLNRDRVLAAGRVNARASRLLDRVTNSLTTIVRDLCETRGVQPEIGRAGPQINGDGRKSHLGSSGGLAGQGARWLAQNVSAIAAGEGAGQTFVEIRGLVGDQRHDGEIPKAVNRPMPMRFLGKCPTWVEHKRAACGVELRCRQDAVEIYCRACRQTHNPDRLQLLLMKDLERKKITIGKILEVNRMQPEEYQISERMIRHWRQEGKLRPRGFRRVDGREVINRHSDEDVPLYLWADVQKLRAEVPQRKARAG